MVGCQADRRLGFAVAPHTLRECIALVQTAPGSERNRGTRALGVCILAARQRRNLADGPRREKGHPGSEEATQEHPASHRIMAAVSISRSSQHVSIGPTGLFGAQGSSACGKVANLSSLSSKLCLAARKAPDYRNVGHATRVTAESAETAGRTEAGFTRPDRTVCTSVLFVRSGDGSVNNRLRDTRLLHGSLGKSR